MRNSDVNELSDSHDFRVFFDTVWRGKFLIVFVASIFTVAAVMYALSLPNKYKADVLLAPVSEQSSGLLSGQLGGLAAMAGISLGAGSSSDKSALALEILRSREFLTRFIDKHQLKDELLAATGWNSQTNQLVFDPDIYEIKTGEWVREVKPGKSKTPSSQEAYEEFLKIFQVAIREEKRSRMFVLSIEHYSPELVQEWVSLLVSEINSEMKLRDQMEANRSVEYLNKQIQETTLSEIRSSLYMLLEEQMKTLMMTNVRDEYVFKTIDPAVIPEEKSNPKRALIVIFAFLLGVSLSVLFLMIRRSLKS